MFGVERALFYLNFIAELVLLCRLIHCGLYRIYRSLFLYWLVQALGGVALLILAGRIPGCICMSTGERRPLTSSWRCMWFRICIDIALSGASGH